MSRRLDVRRFGRGPDVAGLRRVEDRWGEGFPFHVPAVAAVESVRLDGAPVTLLAGDNGTGKSTIVEAVARRARGRQADARLPRRPGSLHPGYAGRSVSELVAIWVGGAAVLVLVGLAAGIFLRFTRVGREQELSLGDVTKILLVIVARSCGVYTLLALAT